MRYLTALICLNGHIATERLEEETDPEPFCEKCGAGTISECPNCHKRIRGQVEDSGFIGSVQPRAHCRDCGSAFPWRQRALDAFNEAVRLRQELEEIDADEAQSIREFASGVAEGNATDESTRLAFKLWAKKHGVVAAKAFLGPMVDFASTTIAKTIAALVSGA